MPITSGPPDSYPIDDSPNASWTQIIALLTAANAPSGTLSQVALELARIRVAESANSGLELENITTYANAGP